MQNFCFAPISFRGDFFATSALQNKEEEGLRRLGGSFPRFGKPVVDILARKMSHTS